MFRWSRRNAGRKPARSPRARLLVQGLEGRVVPATFNVVNNFNSGPGSLRQAITDANVAPGADVVEFDPTVFASPTTISLVAASGQLTIVGDTTINGPGASMLTITGNNVTRVFNVEGPGVLNVTLRGLTVTGGNGTNGGLSPGDGGGIRIADEAVTLENVAVVNNAAGSQDGGGVAVASGSTALLTVRNSTISGNTGRNGAGIYFFSGGGLLLENTTVANNSGFNNGVVGGAGIYFFGPVAAGGFTIRNSTISSNVTGGSGGGILLRSFSGTAAIANSTIFGNSAGTNDLTAGFGGGGIAVQLPQGNPAVRLSSSIVSGNSALNNGRHDIASATTNVDVTFSAVGSSNGFNLSGTSFGNLPFGTNLNLQPLFEMGGPSPTHIPGAGSPVIGAGINLSGLTTDQRGANFPRAAGGATDIGAVEYAPPPTIAAGPLPNITTIGSFYDFTITYGGAAPINVSTIDSMDVAVAVANVWIPCPLVSVDQPSNGSPRTATYRFHAPGGTFGSEDNGNYLIRFLGGQVVTVDGGTVGPFLNLGTVQVAIPARYTVTNLDDAGPGSLRQAILDANANNDPNLQDVINFLAGLTGTIQLTSTLNITQSVAINGPGAQSLVVSGGKAVRVFNVDGPGRLPVRLSDLTITGGSVAGDGGGIFEADEDLTLDRVVVTGNRTTGTFPVSHSGGGIAVGPGGWLTVRNSTISGNQAGGPGNTFATGGGIYFFDGGSLLMENSTVTGNTASGDRGGGGFSFTGSPTASGVTIRNSTIANNQAPTGGGLTFTNLNTAVAPVVIQNSTITGNTSTTTTTTPGYGGGGLAVTTVMNGATGVLGIETTVVSGNIANVVNGRTDIAVSPVARVNLNFSAVGDPDGFVPSGTSSNNLPFGLPLGLNLLANNGGPTLTIAIAANSPLRNAGTNPAGLAFDQRGPGFARVSGVAADIGAFEFQGAVPPQVVGVELNAGQANATQRSRVTSIAVTFNAVVAFAGAVADAFTVSRINGGAVGGFTATANVVGGVTVVTLTGFTGAETQFGSLADGRYTLLVRANQVTANGQQLDGDGDGTGGDNFTLNGSAANGLFRLFGDADGSGVVNAADFGQFRPAFGSSVGQTAYRDFLDFDGDGSINAFDFGQFRPRFGAGVP